MEKTKYFLNNIRKRPNKSFWRLLGIFKKVGRPDIYNEIFPLVEENFNNGMYILKLGFSAFYPNTASTLYVVIGPVCFVNIRYAYTVLIVS